jgi:Asp-tRNA(Asn)/Glu-tRNA(Gln) amidotransferase A subunit family amidase
MKEAWRLTGSEAHDLMVKNELTVEAYAKSLLSRIKERDETVKAWAYLDPEFVLERARELDKIPEEKRGPLHGIAVGVKDVILTKDMPTQYNSPMYESDKPSGVDAGPIATLRAAGALIFGKTTTTEFAANSNGDTFQNRTSNAHSPTRTPGGSSSGSGAAAGDFQVPITLGTQTGGSTIRPGSFNGTYAFKPTWGSISREGLAQYSMTCDTLGLYARSVEDLELLAKVFQLADDEPLPTESFQIRGAKIAFCKSPVWDMAGPGLLAAWDKAQDLLSKQGASIEQLDMPDEFSQIHDWHRKVLAGEGRTSFLGREYHTPHSIYCD